MSTAAAAEVPICFADTETDSTNPTRQIWEVGIVRRDPDGAETEYHAYLPINLALADPFALRIGRFWDRHPQGRWLSGVDKDANPHMWQLGVVDRHTAALQVARLTFGSHIIGAVPNFDTEGFDRWLRVEQLLPGWHYHLGCVENLAVGFLAGRGQPMPPPWKSSELTEALGVEPGTDDEKHTALGDVRWAMRMYDAVMSGGTA